MKLGSGCSGGSFDCSGRGADTQLIADGDGQATTGEAHAECAKTG